MPPNAQTYNTKSGKTTAQRATIKQQRALQTTATDDNETEAPRQVPEQASLKRAARSLKGLFTKDGRDCDPQQPAAVPSDPTRASMKKAPKRKHGEAMVEVQIASPKNATSTNATGRLKRPSRTSASASLPGRPAHTNLFDVLPSPEQRAKSAKTYGTRSKAGNKPLPDASMNPASSRSVQQPENLPSKHTEDTDPVPAGRIYKRQYASRRQVRQGDAKAARHTGPVSPTRRSPRHPPHKNYVIETIEANLDDFEDAEFDPTYGDEESESDEVEDAAHDEQSVELNEEPEEGEEEEEPDNEEDDEQVVDANEQINGDVEEEDTNEQANGEIEGDEEPDHESDEAETDEFKQPQFNLCDQGKNWERVHNAAEKVREEDESEQPSHDFVRHVMRRTMRAIKDFKKISRPDPDVEVRCGNDIDRPAVEARIQRTLDRMQKHVGEYSAPPITKGKKTKRSDPEKSAELQEVYSHVIPALVSLLKSQLSCRYWENFIETEYLQELVKLQQLTIRLCEKIKRWNEVVLVNHEKKSVSIVNIDIRKPLEEIRDAFKGELRRREAESSRRAKENEIQERRRQRAKEEKYLELEMQQDHERRQRAMKEALDQRIRERQAARNKPQIPRSCWSQGHSTNVRHSLPDDTRNGDSRRRNDFDAPASGSESQNASQDHCLPGDTWSENEDLMLIDALREFKGVGEGRISEILKKHGGRNGHLQHRTLRETILKVQIVKQRALDHGLDDVIADLGLD